MFRQLSGRLLSGISKFKISIPQVSPNLLRYSTRKKTRSPFAKSKLLAFGRDSPHHSLSVVPEQNTCYLSHYPPKKRFTVNGAITSLTSPDYYFVDPAEENRRILLPAICKGAFLMLYGTRGSGKSTRVYRAIDQLSNNFCCLGITFQNGVDFRSLDSFWKSFGARLFENYQSIFKDKLPFSSASEFSSTFKASNKETLFGGKKVVLFVDELDRLYQAPQQVIDSVLDTLCGLKQESIANCLQSFVGIGPFSILSLAGKSSSPFNVRDAVQVRYWTREEVHHLFSQFSTMLDSKIVDDIHERTAGHPGLVCLCGKIIDEKEQTLSENYDLWLQYATTKLEKAVIEWPTMQKMVETLSSSSEDIKLARILLRQQFIPNTISPIVLNTQELNRGKFLAAEGALIPGDLSTFRIPSPLVHRLLLERVLTIDKRAKIPSEAVPFITSLQGTTIDVKKLLTTTIAYIEPSIIKAAFHKAHKKSRLPGMKRDSFVPQEAVYHAELFAILRDWLPSDVSLLTQVNLPSMDSNSRCDLFIELSPSSRIVIELVANAPIAVIEEHYSRALQYGKHLDATEIWVLHFTLKKEGRDFHYPVPKDKSLKVIHVWHNADFSLYKVK